MGDLNQDGSRPRSSPTVRIACVKDGPLTSCPVCIAFRAEGSVASFISDVEAKLDTKERSLCAMADGKSGFRIRLTFLGSQASPRDPNKWTPK